MQEVLPDPPVPVDLDLRAFDWMPLDVRRLLASDTVVVASAEAFRAAVLLWCTSWHQVPASSLPHDERLLAKYAGFGRDTRAWRSVSDEALRGFKLHSDGRLYHHIIAEKALEAKEKKRKERGKTAAATEAARLANLARRGNVTDTESIRDGLRHDAGDEPDRDKDKDLDLEESVARCVSRFKQAYPPRPGNDEDWPRAERKLRALLQTGVDGELIVAEAGAYAEEMRRQKRYGTEFVKQAWRWLGSKVWPDVAAARVLAELGPKEPDWDRVVKRWLKNPSLWPRWAGNEPGSVGCECPAQHLVDNGINPLNGAKLHEGSVFVHVTTPEWTAHQQFCAEHRIPLRVFELSDGGVVKRGAFFDRRVPDGYDEATCDRLPPKSEDAA